MKTRPLRVAVTPFGDAGVTEIEPAGQILHSFVALFVAL